MSDINFDAVFPVHKVKALTERNSAYFSEFSLSLTSILSMNSDELRDLASDNVKCLLDIIQFHSEAKHRLEEAVRLNQAVYARLLSVLSDHVD